MVAPLSLFGDNFSSTRTILMVLDFLERGDQCACFKTNLKRFHRREKDLESDEKYFVFFSSEPYFSFENFVRKINEEGGHHITDMYHFYFI